MGLALTLGMRLFRSGLQHVLGLALGLGLGLVVLSPTVSASGLLPSLSLASPGDGSNVSGNVTFVAVADGDGLTSLQFRVDGGDYGSAITAGSCRTTFDTRTAADGPHTIQAVGFDGSGNSVASYPATIFVNNLAPAISDIWLANLTTSSVTVGWSTATLADGQVEFGSTSAYGNASARDYAATTNHAQDLTGLSAGTTYHFRVLSVGQNGVLSVSGNYVFATAAAAAPPPPSNPGNPTPTPTPTPTPGPTPTPTPTPAPTPGPTPGGPTPTPSPTPVAPVTPTPFPTPAPSPTPSPVPPPSGSLGTRTSTGTALPTIRRQPPQFALTPEPGAVIPSTVGDTQVQARVSSGSTSATAAARARASSTAKTTTKSTTSQLTAPSASPAPPPTTTAPQATTGKSRATVVVVAVPCSEPDPFAAKGGVGLCVAGKWVELWKGSGVAARRGK